MGKKNHFVLNIILSLILLENKMNKAKNSKYTRLMLNGIANIIAGDNCENQKLHQNSIHYFIKGLDYFFDFYIKQNYSNNSSNIKLRTIKDFIQFYYFKASEIDKKLNDSIKLINIDELMKELRDELSSKRQSNAVAFINEKIEKNISIEFKCYDKVKSYLDSLINDVSIKSSSLNFIRKVTKCKPILIYSPPGMGKKKFIEMILLKYEGKLMFNLIRIDFVEFLKLENDYSGYFQNILFTIMNSKKVNVVLLENLEFIQNFNFKLICKLIEQFLCEIDLLNGYETLIIGITCIPWLLPSFLTFRFFKFFHIKLANYEEIREILRDKLSRKSIFFYNLFNSLNDSFDEISSSIYDCTFKIIDRILDEFINKLNENIKELISSEESCLNNNEYMIIENQKQSFFNLKLFKQLIQENIKNLVELNKIPTDILSKYELFSIKYDN
jgi:hypothetical protein